MRNDNTNSSINYVKIKRDKEGKCNICGQYNSLTWDHIPPKRTIFFDDVEIASVFNKYSTGKYPREYSQNGTKFRTICGKCNNELGTYYDIYLVEFIKEASEKIFNGFPKKENITCNINPTKVIKSLFGHLLAAKGEYENSLIDIEMREFLFDKSSTIPNFNIYYWFHPYPNIEIMRDLGLCKLEANSEPEVFSMLKMYPIAFYITKKSTYENLGNLKKYCSSDINAYVDIPMNISIKDLKEADWPSLVDDNTLLLAGESIRSSIISKPRDFKDKRKE